jgi:amidase
MSRADVLIDAVDTARLVRSGEATAREITEAAIGRVLDLNSKYSFLAVERFEAALLDADKVDVGAPLAGVPILTKDFLAYVAGMPITEGSAFVTDWVPRRDSDYVGRLKRAGAVILGSSTSSEFAILSDCETHRYGATLNPHIPSMSTGGSSGGSAAAVASGAVPAATASDAGGSIRIPAACCGLLGLKPTRGRISLGPEFGDLAGGLWNEHVITATARDSAAFLEATSGPRPGDPYHAPPPRLKYSEAINTKPPKLRVAVSVTLPRGERIHPDHKPALTWMAEQMQEQGHEVTEGDPRFDVETAESALGVLEESALAARIAMWSRRLGREPGCWEMEPCTWHLYERGRCHGAAELLDAITRLQHATREIATFFATVDVWISPTLGRPLFPVGYLWTGPDSPAEEVLSRDSTITALTWPANISGQPALSYPVIEESNGAPIGVQLTGQYGREELLLSLAAELDRAPTRL